MAAKPAYCPDIRDTSVAWPTVVVVGIYRVIRTEAFPGRAGDVVIDAGSTTHKLVVGRAADADGVSRRGTTGVIISLNEVIAAAAIPGISRHLLMGTDRATNSWGRVVCRATLADFAGRINTAIAALTGPRIAGTDRWAIIRTGASGVIEA